MVHLVEDLAGSTSTDPLALDPLPVGRGVEVAVRFCRTGPGITPVSRFEDVDVGGREIGVVERIVFRAVLLRDRGDVFVACSDGWRRCRVPKDQAVSLRGPEKRRA